MTHITDLKPLPFGEPVVFLISDTYEYWDHVIEVHAGNVATAVDIELSYLRSIWRTTDERFHSICANGWNTIVLKHCPCQAICLKFTTEVGSHGARLSAGILSR